MNRKILYIKIDPYGNDPERENLFTPNSDPDLGEAVAICDKNHVFGPAEQTLHFGIVTKNLTVLEEDDLLMFRYKGISRSDPAGPFLDVNPLDWKPING